MYTAGDKIIYASSGVCIVEEICTPNFSREERGKEYYRLRPIHGSETIYAPVDTKAFIRPIMTKAEAEDLIARIPGIEPSACSAASTTALRQQYDEFFRAHDCEQYIRLLKGIYSKGENGKKLGQTDLRYMKRAEDSLHSELAAALEIEPAQVPDYIKSAIGDL